MTHLGGAVFLPESHCHAMPLGSPAEFLGRCRMY